MMNHPGGRPKVAVIDPNTLAAMGMKQILQNVMPIMTVDTYGSQAELEANGPDGYFHYFAAMHIVVENMSFFAARKRKTIVLTLSLDTMSQLSDFHCRIFEKKDLNNYIKISRKMDPINEFYAYSRMDCYSLTVHTNPESFLSNFRGSCQEEIAFIASMIRQIK